MPKQTFFNLPEEKQENIIDVALEEFSQFDYKLASVSRIVENANISKGSMYQYFENKKDLYLYLIDYAADAKLSFLTRHICATADDFFCLYKDLLYTSAKYNLSYPKYSRILYHATRESYSHELGNVAFELRSRSKDFIANLLHSAKNQNQVRNNIDIDLIAFFISQISIDMEDYIANKFGFSFDKVLVTGSDKLPVSDKELEKIIDDLISFIKNGLHN